MQRKPKETSVNLFVNLGGMAMKNPVTVASGTFGAGMEYHDFVDVAALGAVTTKGVSLNGWEGNASPRIAETASGMLNSIGLQNPGVQHLKDIELPWLAEIGATAMVNVSGHSFDEYVAVIEALEEAPVAAYEVNISCPNVDAGGMMNAIGLQNPGIDVFCKRDIPFLQKYDTKIIVNVCGHAPEEYLAVVERLAEEKIDMMEINISCPNVNAGFLAFGQDPKHVEELTAEIKKIAKQPVIMKLTPNVTDIAEIARAAEAGGADAVSLINTLTGMKIDVNRRTFALANKTGGVSGPAVHPVAVRMVYQVANAVKIPVIGMGGVATAEDALEFILAGATGVAVGTANFVNPTATIDVIDGIQAYMEKYGVKDIHELIGAVK